MLSCNILSCCCISLSASEPDSSVLEVLGNLSRAIKKKFNKTLKKLKILYPKQHFVFYLWVLDWDSVRISRFISYHGLYHVFLRNAQNLTPSDLTPEKKTGSRNALMPMQIL